MMVTEHVEKQALGSRLRVSGRIRMQKIVLAIAIVVALPSPQVRAQNAADVGAVISAAAAAMGAGTLEAIQYSGTGATYPTGQAFTSGGAWPRFTVTKYSMSVNFSIPIMRQELIRIDDAIPTRGGGAGGFNPATGQGGIRPIPGDIIQNQTTDGRTEVGAINI